jgi:hypothetical protein
MEPSQSDSATWQKFAYSRPMLLQTCFTNIKSGLNPLRARCHVRFLSQGVSKPSSEPILNSLTLASCHLEASSCNIAFKSREARKPEATGI